MEKFVSSNDRLDDVDIAKGIGIVLVVFGHIVARDIEPAGNDWYLVLRDIVYSFHMAFFFYLSGLVFFSREGLPNSLLNYWSSVKKKATRLLLPFLMMAVIVYLAKWSAGFWLAVDRPVGNLQADVIGLLLYPTESYSSSLWYLVTLFLVFAIVPLLGRLFGGRLELIFLFALALHFFPAGKLFSAHQVCRYLVFFVFAYFATRNIVVYREFLAKNCLPLFALFIGSLIFIPLKDLRFVGAVLSIFSLHAISLKAKGVARGILTELGRQSFPIYLFNVLAIGGVKAIVLKYYTWDGFAFFLVAPLLLLSGLVLPIYLRKMVLVKFDFLEKLTR